MKKREINNNNKLKIVLVCFFENSVVREYTWLIVCNYLYCFFQKRWNELICLLGLHLNLKFTHCTATKLEVEMIISKRPVGSLYWCLFIGIFFWCFFLFWVSFWHCNTVQCSWQIQRTLLFNSNVLYL